MEKCKNICFGCRYLIIKGVVAKSDGSTIPNKTCFFRQISLNNLLVPFCPQFHPILKPEKSEKVSTI